MTATPLKLEGTVQADVQQYLTMMCAGEKLAINIGSVKEIIEILQITSIPLAPEYLKGVINLRGRVVPVLDLSARLTQQPLQLSKRSSMILVEVPIESASQSLAILVDEVDQILDVEPENIQPAPKLGASIRTDFIEAMAKVDDEFIIILAVNQLLTAQELEQLSELSASTITE